jgi:hypothetical protein
MTDENEILPEEPQENNSEKIDSAADMAHRIDDKLNSKPKIDRQARRAARAGETQGSSNSIDKTGKPLDKATNKSTEKATPVAGGKGVSDSSTEKAASSGGEAVASTVGKASAGINKAAKVAKTADKIAQGDIGGVADEAIKTGAVAAASAVATPVAGAVVGAALETELGQAVVKTTRRVIGIWWAGSLLFPAFMFLLIISAVVSMFTMFSGTNNVTNITSNACVVPGGSVPVVDISQIANAQEIVLKGIDMGYSKNAIIAAVDAALVYSKLGTIDALTNKTPTPDDNVGIYGFVPYRDDKARWIVNKVELPKSDPNALSNAINDLKDPTIASGIFYSKVSKDFSSSEITAKIASIMGGSPEQWDTPSKDSNSNDTSIAIARSTVDTAAARLPVARAAFAEVKGNLVSSSVTESLPIVPSNSTIALMPTDTVSGFPALLNTVSKSGKKGSHSVTNPNLGTYSFVTSNVSGTLSGDAFQKAEDAYVYGDQLNQDGTMNPNYNPSNKNAKLSHAILLRATLEISGTFLTIPEAVALAKSNYAKSHTTTITVDNQITVAKWAAPVFVDLIAQWEGDPQLGGNGFSLNQDIASYSAIKEGKQYGDHAGYAVDLAPTKIKAYGATGLLVPQLKAIQALLDRYGGILQWSGLKEYGGVGNSANEFHFSIAPGTVADDVTGWGQSPATELNQASCGASNLVIADDKGNLTNLVLASTVSLGSTNTTDYKTFGSPGPHGQEAANLALTFADGTGLGASWLCSDGHCSGECESLTEYWYLSGTKRAVPTSGTPKPLSVADGASLSTRLGSGKYWFAIDNAQAQLSAGRLHQVRNNKGELVGDTNIPLGALLFWDSNGTKPALPPASNSSARNSALASAVTPDEGHVAIYVGNGKVVTNWASGSGLVIIDAATITYSMNRPHYSTRYLGWSYAPDSWVK